MSASFNIGVFVTWTVTSFLCHQLGKKFLDLETHALESIQVLDNERVKRQPLRPDVSPTSVWHSIVPPVVLTGCQLAFCALFVHLRKTKTDSRQRETTVKMLHALATLATNLSLALVPSASTFAIKMLEPVTSAFVQYVWMGVGTSCVSLSSLPFIVGGAIAFAGNPLETSHTASGMMGALMSNILLTFRNVEIKKITSNPGSPPLSLRYGKRGTILPMVSILGVCLILNLSTQPFFGMDITWTRFARSFQFVCLSGAFHVTYSYVSTSLVLSQVSVLSHAVANIVKRLVVVLLLYGFGTRTATPWNFVGLVVCATGLLFFALDKSRSREKQTFSKEGDRAVRFEQYGRRIVTLSVVTCVSILVLSDHFSLQNDRLPINGNAITTKSDDPLVLDSQQAKKPPMIQKLLLQKREHLAIPSTHNVLASIDDKKNTSTNSSTKYNNNFKNRFKDLNAISKQQSTTIGVIKESQRLHLSVIGQELRNFKYAFLMDIPTHENKGDSAIALGQIYFLARMNITVKFYCGDVYCSRNKVLQQAKNLAKQYSPDELVIVCNGGGNIISYPQNDRIRIKVLNNFPSYRVLVFPQSIWIKNSSSSHVDLVRQYYCCNPNLTIVLRDPKSFKYANILFNGGTRLLMAPDMAFHIGHTPRFMDPVFDILWIKRNDTETPGYSLPGNFPDNITVHVSDWIQMKTLGAKTALEKSSYATTMGFFFLQRGRVVITDRLHGHILSTLMDIPHVLIDNGAKKLSSYHHTWTQSLDNTLLTDDPSKALGLAMELLKQFNRTLPGTLPFINARTMENRRERLVITDRLHGHILSNLMDIPHVLIDNGAKKLSSYHHTWKQSLDNTLLTDDPSKALGLAMELLKKFNRTLPGTVPFINARTMENRVKKTKA